LGIGVDRRDRELKLEKSEKIHTWATTVAVVVYAIVSCLTLSQIKKTNELTMEYQKVSLRPWIFAMELTTRFVDPGKPNELWEMSMPLSNPTSNIAVNVAVYMYTDDKEEILANSRPERGTVGVIPPVSIMETGVGCTITKQQVIRAIEEKSEIYVHAVVWYEQKNGAKYETRYTYRMNYYKEGIEVGWRQVTADLR